MSKTPAADEPSIEEILASIRQIISDDDEGQEEKAQEEKAQALDNPVRDGTDDILNLSEKDLVAPMDEEDEEDQLDENPFDMDDDLDDTIEVDMRDMPDPEEIEDEPVPEPVSDLTPDDILNEIRSQSETRASHDYSRDPYGDQKAMPSDILSSAAQSAALSSLNKLTSRMPINRPRSYDGVTLEDIVREMMTPMLREWMDDHLPPMVERIVQRELEKLARRAMDE